MILSEKAADAAAELDAQQAVPSCRGTLLCGNQNGDGQPHARPSVPG